MEKIIEYIIKTYGFEVVPPSIPLNSFQRLKRDFYIFILNKISKSLFFFLRDKVSPIKFKKTRPKGEMFLKRGNLELSISPIPVNHSSKFKDSKSIFNSEIGGFGTYTEYGTLVLYRSYFVSLYYEGSTLGSSSSLFTSQSSVNYYIIAFPVNDIQYVKIIDAHFSDVSDLKSILRNNKLNKILNGEV